jgi:carboxymethylenebutenolidase
MSKGKIETMTMADGAKIGVYHVAAEGARRGGLVLIQEIFGISEHIKACCDGFAADGYEVLAPSLFDRQSPGFVSGYTQEEMQKGAGLAYGEPLDKRVADVQVCIDALDGPVFTVGYCYGGSVVYAASCRCEGLAAASSYYGRQVPTDLIDEEPKCKTICHFGKSDAGIPLEGVEKFAARHPEVTVYLYDAGHGFNSDRPTHHDEAAAKLARERTLALFKANGG